MDRFIRLKTARCVLMSQTTAMHQASYKYTKDVDGKMVFVNKDKIIEVQPTAENEVVCIYFSNDFESHGYYYDFENHFKFKNQLEIKEVNNEQ